MLHGLYWLLNNLADGAPIVLAVDDLQWSDTESLRFLNYLAPRLDGLRLVVLATSRSGERSTDLTRLAASPEATVLRPAPLSTEATAELCARCLGGTVEPDFAAACRDATGGNPFFLEALLREAADRRLSTSSGEAVRVQRIAPAAVTAAVLLRLSGAPATAGALVRAVAVIGDGASVAEAAAMAELAEEEAAGAADQLVALDILRPAAHLEFAHPIVREAVRADIGPRELAVAHARGARILETCGATEERIAAQIVQAAPTGDAGRVELLRRVAGEAIERGAPAAAVAWLGRALAEPPPPSVRAELLIELGSAELRLGAPGGVPHLTEAVALSRDPEQLTIAVRRLAVALTLAGHAERAVTAIEAAIDDVGSDHPELSLLLEGEIWTHALQAGLETRARAARRLERHAAGLDGSTPGQRLVLASLASTRARASDTAEEAAAHLEGALADGRFVGDQQAGIVGLGLSFDLSLGLIAAGALDAADTYVEQVLESARAQAAIVSVAYLTGRRGLIALRRGAVAAAEADGRTALELLTLHNVSLGVPFALGLVVEALVEGGEPDAAERELRDRGFDADVPPGPTSNHLLEARARLRLAQGRMGEGIDDLIEFGRRDELWTIANPLASRLALARSTGARRDRRARAGAADGARRPRAGAPLGRGQRHRRRPAGGGPDGPRRRPAGPPRGGSRRAGRLAGTARARPSAHRPGRRAAPGEPSCGGANRARGGARPRRAHQCPPCGRARPNGAARRRREVERAGGQRAGCAHRLRASRRRTGCGGPQQPGDRAGALCDPQDRRDPPRPRLPQTRHHRSGKARPGAQRRTVTGSRRPP